MVVVGLNGSKMTDYISIHIRHMKKKQFVVGTIFTVNIQ